MGRFHLPLTVTLTLALLLLACSRANSAPAPPTVAPFPNRIVFIRHAEKGPPKFPNGLSDKGKQRAQFLRELFGRDSEYDFGLMFAAPRTAQEKEDERTYATVAPLASDLGLEVDISCTNSPPSCILAAVEEFVKTSDKDILISWKHRELHQIATALGASNARIHYSDERNDVIWIMQGGAIVEKRSQHMPGLDDERVDEGDPDLEIERPALELSWLIGGGGDQKQLVL